MNWTIEVKPAAEKQYLKLDRPTRRRIKEALSEIERSMISGKWRLGTGRHGRQKSQWGASGLEVASGVSP